MNATINKPAERRRSRPNRQIEFVRTAIDLAGRLSPSIASAIVFGLMVRPRRRGGAFVLQEPALTQFRIPYWSGGLQAYSWPGDRKALLVHGWDASSSDFADLVPRLARTGWGGLVYDAPAHGRSGGRTTDFLDLGRALRLVLAEHGPFEALISHSFGSLVALHGLAEFPGAPPRLIVCGGSPTSLDHSFQIYTEPLQLAPRVRSQLERQITRRLGRPSRDFSATGALGRLDSDVLVIHDRQDPVVPFESARRLAGAARHAELLQTSGLGHRGWLKHEPTLDNVVAFLSS